MMNGECELSSPLLLRTIKSKRYCVSSSLQKREEKEELERLELFERGEFAVKFLKF